MWPFSRNSIIKYIPTVDVAVRMNSPGRMWVGGIHSKREYFIVISIGSPDPPTAGRIGDIAGSWAEAISIPTDPSSNDSLKVRTFRMGELRLSIRDNLWGRVNSTSVLVGWPGVDGIDPTRAKRPKIPINFIFCAGARASTLSSRDTRQIYLRAANGLWTDRRNDLTLARSTARRNVICMTNSNRLNLSLRNEFHPQNSLCSSEALGI